jgi:hypothetical protein
MAGIKQKCYLETRSLYSRARGISSKCIAHMLAVSLRCRYSIDEGGVEESLNGQANGNAETQTEIDYQRGGKTDRRADGGLARSIPADGACCPRKAHRPHYVRRFRIASRKSSTAFANSGDSSRIPDSRKAVRKRRSSPSRRALAIWRRRYSVLFLVSVSTGRLLVPRLFSSAITSAMSLSCSLCSWSFIDGQKR